MKKDRVIIAKAVLEGKLSADHLTWEEVREIEAKTYELIMQKEMDRAVERGCSVFDGIEGDTVQ